MRGSGGYLNRLRPGVPGGSWGQRDVKSGWNSFRKVAIGARNEVSVEDRRGNRMQWASFELLGGALVWSCFELLGGCLELTRRKRAPHMELMWRTGIVGEDVIGEEVGRT